MAQDLNIRELMHISAPLARSAPLFVIGALAVLIGGDVAWREGLPFLSLGVAPRDSVAVFERGDVTPGLSYASQQLVLGDCLRTLDGLYLRTRPPAERASMARACRTLASAATRATPTSSFAWYALARTAAVLGDVPAMNAALVTSGRTGPNELWLAVMRVDLAESLRPQLSPAAAALDDADLGLLIANRRGFDTIRARFVTDPAFRARLMQLVEQLPEASRGQAMGLLNEATYG
jgi:hypothetical protein